MTKGHGTVGGASSASPTFTGSLNFNQAREGEAPSIDFAGGGRVVPWATWYEDNTKPFGKEEIFASRFDSSNDVWVFAGQGRVARQRLVYGLLAEELRTDIHALSLTTLTPEEAE